MDHQSQPEQAWIDLLLGELQDPEAAERIHLDLEEDEEASEAYRNLSEAIHQLQEYYTNERDPMLDLTYEQKQELYSAFTDIFPRPRRAKAPWRPHLKLLFSALGFAVFVMATVPIVQMMTIPPKAPSITTGNPTYIDDSPPVLPPQPPPPVVKKDDEPDHVEEPEYRPSIEDLLTPPMNTTYKIRGIDQFVPDVSGIDIGEDIMNMIDVDVVPNPITTIAPPYPPQMRQYRVEGKVMLEFVVDENGYVRDPVIVSSTNAGFDKVSLETIRKWRFEPGQKDGKIVKVRMRMPFVYSLK